MKSYRVIARLDIKGPNLVKGIHLEGLRVMGKPEEFARYYYENGADELIYVDVVASLYDRNSLHDIISKTAKETFIPLTVGGGLRTIDDIRGVLRAGADKVSLNTAVLKNQELIREASRKFGSSTIVVAIEAIKQPDGTYFAYTDNGRNYTGVEVIEWAKKVQELGAGEILLTSVDREGTGLGFDCELTKKVTDVLSIPVITHGGAGKMAHVFEALSTTNADAVALASMLHYDAIRTKNSTSGFDEEGNIEFLKQGKRFSIVDATSLKEVKDYLISKRIDCRHTLKLENIGVE